ncbi:uncharacterized protein LOC129584117 [Paramacrobiotus metropolitanus]|uniref:uncharacterized protein LOC129584117 n=1 Tax=Paramacrobiotus metropolitanus TaxID=2943436 RepID=UPI002445C1EC|nr:uncharacterized protein LOC129584117 [Paramacrobiotus metropolitanus]
MNFRQKPLLPAKVYRQMDETASKASGSKTSTVDKELMPHDQSDTKSNPSSTEKREYRFPFEIATADKVLLIDGFPGTKIFIEIGKKKYLESNIKKKQKTDGTYLADLRRYLFLEDDSCQRIEELKKLTDQQVKGKSGFQGISGRTFMDVIKAWADSVGISTEGDNVTAGMNNWKSREILALDRRHRIEQP